MCASARNDRFLTRCDRGNYPYPAEKDLLSKADHLNSVYRTARRYRAWIMGVDFQKRWCEIDCGGTPQTGIYRTARRYRAWIMGVDFPKRWCEIDCGGTPQTAIYRAAAVPMLLRL